MNKSIPLTELLKEYDVPTLARWEATFNIYKWPDDYPIPKPDNTKELEAASTAQWKALSNSGLVPHKEFLRSHNTVINDHMTDEQFEAWWSSRHSVKH